MIRSSAVRESNSKAKVLHDLVAVFVGGTGGIGASTAKEFFLRTTRPRANLDAGNKLIADLKQINPEGEAFVVQKDISLLRNVDELVEDLKQREPKIHCLFLTAGYMTLKGRTETDEGIDRKMAVNYYSRVRCILKFMSSLQAASNAGELARVITVLAAGSEGEVRLDDLDLKHDFTLHACLAHCVVMTDFIIEELAKRFPGISFSHSYPGTVKSGIANELSGPVRLAVKVMYAVMAPWILDVRESGERHFFQMTNKCYPAANGGVGIEIPEGLSTMRGSNGILGSGAYLLDWDGKTTGDERILKRYRDMRLGRTVWEHTMAIFEEAERRLRRDSKRPAPSEQEGSDRPPPNPIGWRQG